MTKRIAPKTSFPKRIISIDAFRGITFFFMILVNELHGIKDISPWLKHMPADVDAMSFPDIVFPAFLFIVGMSIPFGLQARKERGESNLQILGHILLRTLALVTMGFFMVNAESGFDESKMPFSIATWSLLSYLGFMLIWGVYRFDNRLVNLSGRVCGILILLVLAMAYKGDASQPWMSPQWWGILGLIGWAYLITCTIYIACGPKTVHIVAAIGLCTLYYGLSHSELGKHPILGVLLSQDAHAAHSSIVLSGLLCCILFFQDQQNRTPQKRILSAFFACLTIFVSALLSHAYFPISKIYATPTWCLFSAAICVAVYSFLFYLIEIGAKADWTKLTDAAANNPLVCYLLPFIVEAILQLFHVENPLHALSGTVGILACILYSAFILFIVSKLNRCNFKMRF